LVGYKGQLLAEHNKRKISLFSQACCCWHP